VGKGSNVGGLGGNGAWLGNCIVGTLIGWTAGSGIVGGNSVESVVEVGFVGLGKSVVDSVGSGAENVVSKNEVPVSTPGLATFSVGVASCCSTSSMP
jgi:hypothetical protein